MVPASTFAPIKYTNEQFTTFLLSLAFIYNVVVLRRQIIIVHFCESIM